MPLREWIQVARKRGASDLHLESAATPVARVRGDLLAVGEILAPADVKAMTHELLGPQAWEQFTQRGSADLSLVVEARAAGSICIGPFVGTPSPFGYSALRSMICGPAICILIFVA